MGVRNDAAHRALLEYCEDALTRLREAVEEGEELPHTWRQTFKFSDAGGTGGRREVVDWSTLVRRHVVGLEALPSYGMALRVLEADEKFVGRAVWQEGPEQTVASFLGRLLQEQGDLASDREAFERVYGETEDYFYRDTVEYRYVAPLKRFRMEADEIQLDSRLSIVRIPHAWSEEMLAQAEEYPPVWDPYLKVASARYGLVRYMELQKEPEMDPYRTCAGKSGISTVSESFRDVCGALRLFKRGAVGYEYIVPRPTNWVPLSSRTLHGGGLRGHPGKKYVLSKQDGEDFVVFWDLYRKATSARAHELNLAVRRFSMGYERATEEDRLVDHMIGLEALLLESQGELQHKLALRGGALLGRNASERESIADELRAAYRQRSRIVHGSGSQREPKIGKGKRKRPVPFDKLVDKTEDHLRGAISKRIESWSGYSKKEMIDELERRIVRGLGHWRSS